MRSSKLSFQQQITLVVGLLLLFFMAAGAIGAAMIGRGQAERLIRDEMADLATTMTSTLDRMMFERFREIRNISELPLLREHWLGAPERARVILDQLQKTLPDYAWIGFAETSGLVRAATRGMLEGQSVAARPWFRDGLAAPSAGDVHEAQLLARLLGPSANGEPFRFVDVAAPVKDEAGKVIGVVGAHLSWTWAEDVRASLLKASRLGDGAQIWVLSTDGKVLLGGAMGREPFDGSTIAAMRSGKRGSIDATVDGERVLASYALSEGYRDYPGLNWIIVAQKPQSLAFARANEIMSAIIWLGLALCVAALAAVFYAGRQLASPIAQLTQAARQIGRDRLITTLPRLSGSSEILDLSSALRALLRRIGHAEHQAEAAIEQSVQDADRFTQELTHLKQLADTDPLTGVLNRRAFLATAEDAMQYFSRYRRNFAILVIDIDFFKKVNDTHGHAIGDAVIQHVTQSILGCVRATDKVARFGGEEFVVLLREIGDRGVEALAERMRNAVRTAVLVRGDANICVTVSIGAALVGDGDADIQDLIERADRALYEAKATGRNRVCMDAPKPRLLKAA